MTMGLDNSKIFHPSPQGLLKILTLKVKATENVKRYDAHGVSFSTASRAVRALYATG